MIKNIIYIYFTLLPYYLYDEANKHGNFCFAGIGLGLIYSQQMFWISNIGIIIVLYNKSNENLYYINIFISFICCCLYLISLFKTIYLIKLLKT